jgi:hypothetical protein
MSEIPWSWQSVRSRQLPNLFNGVALSSSVVHTCELGSVHLMRRKYRAGRYRPFGEECAADTPAIRSLRGATVYGSSMISDAGAPELEGRREQVQMCTIGNKKK